MIYIMGFGLFLALFLFPTSTITLAWAFMLLCATGTTAVTAPVAISHAIHTGFLPTSMSSMLQHTKGRFLLMCSGLVIFGESILFFKYPSNNR